MRCAIIVLVALVAIAAPVQAGTSFTADFSGPTLDSHFVDHDSKYTVDGTAHITTYGGTSNDKFYLSTADVDYADSDWVMELNYTQIGSANTQWNPIEVALGPQAGVSIDKAAYNEPNANVFLSIYPSDPWSDTNGILMLSEGYLADGTKEVWRSTTDGLNAPGNGTHDLEITKIGRDMTYTIDGTDYYTHSISDEAWGWMHGTWGSGTGSAISFGTAADASQVTFNSFSVQVAPKAPTNLSHGHQVMLDRGLQIAGLVYTGFNDYDRWQSANFTTMDFDWSQNHPHAFSTYYMEIMDMDPDQLWCRMYNYEVNENNGGLDPWETSVKLDTFVGYRYGDEVDDLDESARLNDMYSRYRAWNTQYPDSLAYTNVYANQYSTSTLRNYMAVTQPDMLMFDNYPNFSFSNSERNEWYSSMQKFRTLALAGNDGTGTTPIPYGQFLNLYRHSHEDTTPSESYVRLQQNASWAFGYTYVTAFVYNTFVDGEVNSVMFSSIGDTAPTAVFDYVAETNRQSQNLGPALIRMVSSGIFMKPGSGQSVWGTGLSQWSSSAGSTANYTDYITGITPYTNSTPSGGTADSSYEDILVGYFEPLLDDNIECSFADGLHFMIVNGAASGTAAASAQWYHLTFDFTGSNFDALVRLSRDTGEVEAVPLTHISGSQYYLDLYLEGGTGDLFGFWDSSDPLPSIESPIPGDANNDGKVDGSDVTILAGNWQKGVDGSLDAIWADGDFNGDGKVDGSDVTILAGNWQAGVTAAASAVPEPSTLVMLSILTSGLMLWRCRRST